MSPGSEDPVVRSTRREALWVLPGMLAAMLWSLACADGFGYRRDPATLRFVLWFPDWVFWGIVLPWVACAVMASVFAMRVMSDADLEHDVPPQRRHDPTEPRDA